MNAQQQAEALVLKYHHPHLAERILQTIPLTELLAVAEAAEEVMTFNASQMANGKHVLNKAITALRAKLPK